MNTEIFKLLPNESNNPSIKKAAEILCGGGLVAFPTETVYGLGGDATNPSAAKNIYKAKGRPSDNPLIIHIADPADAELYAYTSETYYKLAAAFMPGPLTVILPKKDTVPIEVTGGLDTVAVRCPSHPIARALIRKAGVAIAAPSANLSGSPSPTSGEHVIRDLNGRIEVIIDGGECDIGLESTIIKLDGERATLLRPGAITADALSCICKKVDIAPAVTESLKENERPLSPGMKYRHYAPKAPLILLDGDEEEVLSYMYRRQNAERCVIICYDEELEYLRNERIISIGARDDLNMQAHSLFSALRLADELDGEVVYAHLPSKEGVGLALYNRLIRAAAHTVLEV
ncbi:MAG: threonylcarbamoyl-AMP synthase [Ruminococcaceae bacterium]|nr:threonylcarbamoyl-AMP synthase [Oscillospiraceae bacterium]